VPQLYISVVWCEAFGGDRKDFNYQKSKEIKDIIIRTGEWEQAKMPLSLVLFMADKEVLDE